MYLKFVAPRHLQQSSDCNYFILWLLSRWHVSAILYGTIHYVQYCVTRNTLFQAVLFTVMEQRHLLVQYLHGSIKAQVLLHTLGGRLQSSSHHFVSLRLLDLFLVPKCGPAWVDPLMGLLELGSTGPSERTIFMQWGLEFTTLSREYKTTVLLRTTHSHPSVTNEPWNMYLVQWVTYGLKWRFAFQQTVHAAKENSIQTNLMEKQGLGRSYYQVLLGWNVCCVCSVWLASFPGSPPQGEGRAWERG